MWGRVATTGHRGGAKRRRPRRDFLRSARRAVEAVGALGVPVPDAREELVTVTASAGAGIGTNLQQTLRAVDGALAPAKRAGRDRFDVA